MDNSFSAQPAAFEYDGLAFMGGLPGVVLLQGPEEREVIWAAMPGGVPQVRSRLTPLGAAQEAVFSWTFLDGFRVEWHVTRSVRQDGFSVRTVFTNKSGGPVRLRRLVMLQSMPASLQADTAEWFVMAPFSGFPIADEGNLAGHLNKKRVFQDAMSLYSQQGGRGLFVAAVGPAEADATIELTVDEGGYGVSVFSEMTDIVVDPGESRTSEEVLFMFAPHAEAYADILRWLAVTHGSRTHRGPFMGWCSWYERYSNITAEHVQAVAKAVQEKRDLIPQAVIQIDEGYQRHWGDWRTNVKFPEGWRPVVEAIREAGAVPGIWLAPLGVYEVTGVIHEHPDWFQYQVGAFEPVKGVWQGNTLHYLDPTHPGAQQFIRESIQNALAEGFRYFKIDFNNVHAVRFHDPKATRFQALRRLYQLYRDVMGEETYLNSCCFSLSRAVMGAVDAMRIGGDTGYGWMGNGGLMEGICATAHTAAANGVIMAADPDVYYIKARGNSLTTEQLQSWQGFVGLLGGINMTSEPVHRPDYADSLRELEICTPPVSDRGHSLLPGMELYPSLFGFVAERIWGRFSSVMLFNAKPEVGAVALNCPEVRALGECHLWSFRDGVYLGRSSGEYIEKDLAAWGSRIIRLTPVSPDGAPVLVGSDLHIGMGSAELAQWVVASDAVEIGLTDAGARSGSLWIHSATPLALAAAEQCEATVEAVGKGLWCVRLSNRKRGCGQTIRLAIQGVGKKPDLAPVSAGKVASVGVTLDVIERPKFGVQGQPTQAGVVKLTMMNRGAAQVSGEVVLALDNEKAVVVTPARVQYCLKPGETAVQEVKVMPLQYLAKMTLAVRCEDNPRWLAWAYISMSRLSIKIPGAEDSHESLCAVAGKMESLALPPALAVANLRMSASGRQLFLIMQVQDAEPVFNTEVFCKGTCVEFNGSCVELFAAMPDTKEFCQLYFQPDVALVKIQPFKINWAVGKRAEACPEIWTEFKRIPGGYEWRAMVSFEQLGLAVNARDFLLDFQLTRRVDDKVERIPLLGCAGAGGSNSQYAHLSVVSV